ncbi:MAG TPA: diguanylate cyclase, partial [Candidatus Aquilonibacter sp.]|nr:diguanylate cyclase [Candidatus Aquilonibacter sp.]
MSEARAQRDRRLIQRTAALLSEDYPFDQLIDRICDALRSELNAQIAFVALADEHGSLAIEGVVANDGILPELGPRSPAVVAFTSREPVVDRQGALAVPILHQDRAIGVLSVCASAEQFDEQDERLVGAIARYLAIAARNQRAASFAVPHTRSPQITIAGAVLLALILTIAIGAFTAVRVAQSTDAATASAHETVKEIIGEFDDYILDARQLTASTVDVVASMRNNRRAVERMLARMLQSSRSATIYGIGVWYEPYAFDGVTRYYGPYAHWDAHRKHVVVTYQWMRPSYDFHRQPWYLAGKKARSRAIFTEPYFDTDHVYVTTARSFLNGTTFNGVVTVDSILPALRESMNIIPDDGTFAAVVTPAGNVVVSTRDRDLGVNATSRDVEAYVRRELGRRAVLVSGAIPYTGWDVRYYIKRAVFMADAARLRAVAFVAVVGIWLAALLAIGVALRSRRHVRRAEELEEQRRLLEREIAERVRAEEKLRAHAYTDDLTGLPNRGFLLGQIEAHLEALRLDANQAFAVLFIDIDRFNIVNDSLGHATGDRLLTEFGSRLNTHVRPGDILARMSGDEFVLLTRLREQGDARRRAAEILQSLRHPFSLSGMEFFVTASVGIAIGDARYATASEIVRDADVAMYEAKRAGRATFRVFDRSMHADALEKLALETDLRHALERGEIFVEYQPIVSLVDGRIAGFEALARWRHPTRGRVMPDTFIKIAEQVGLIVELDERVISAACLAASDWMAAYPDLFVAVNFSAAHLARVDDLAIVRRALEASGLPGHALKIEITETAVME